MTNTIKIENTRKFEGKDKVEKSCVMTVRS
jgi:hypothetical protein